jgi:hypothetical protein
MIMRWSSPIYFMTLVAFKVVAAFEVWSRSRPKRDLAGSMIWACEFLKEVR